MAEIVKPKNDKYIHVGSKEIVIRIRCFNGEQVEYTNVKEYAISQGGVLTFVTDDNLRNVVGPAIRWDVTENLD